MKDLILDDLIVNQINKEIQRGEKIIWEGQPQKSLDFSFSRSDALVSAWIERMVILGIFGLFALISLLIGIDIYTYLKFYITLAILVSFIPEALRILQRKKTRYLITNKRIFFQLWHNFKTEFHSIEFDEIKNVVHILETKKDGVVFIGVKNPYRIPFDTYNLYSGERRHQPTLEMIENVEEVTRHIHNGIHGNL
ncbi:MAG: hypothetical protein AAF573_17820 [Bacteroidota bacterium]